MPISVDCPQCGKTFRVKDELAGRKFRCKACRSVVSVPAPPKPSSGDPWDDLDLDSFHDQAPAVHDEDDYEFETPPARRRKTRRKKRARPSSRGGGGMPVGVIVAIVCQCALILLNLLSIVGNIISENPGEACGSVFRILLEGGIILGLLEANSLARWGSIVLSILGMISSLLCCAGLLLAGMPDDVQREFEGFLVILLVVFALHIVIWCVNVVALLLPSSGEYFD
jgi:hypothetical protein